MNEGERIARAQRAQQALDEFIAPILTETRDVYAARLVEVAATELSRDRRADKITALSLAIRILEALEDGIKAVLLDGEMAKKEKLRTEKVETMSRPQRRLLDMIPR